MIQSRANRNAARFIRIAATMVAMMCLAAAMLQAQSTQGGVRGSVMDQQGAAVPKAKVTLTNDGTAEARTALTNNDGGFEFTQLVPATYTLVAESPSFKKFERKNIIVATQEFVLVDVRLDVGSVSESVLVTEEVPLVETSNASQGQVLDNQKLVDLPNLGRNPFMMSKLSSNIVQVGPPAYNRMEDQSGSSEISIAGGPVRGNNYLLDGIPITDANNRAIIIPTLEAVQEVKIQANTYDAEMARTGGGMFNTLMKSEPTTITEVCMATFEGPIGTPTPSSATPPAFQSRSSRTQPGAQALAARFPSRRSTTARIAPSSSLRSSIMTIARRTRQTSTCRPSRNAWVTSRVCSRRLERPWW